MCSSYEQYLSILPMWHCNACAVLKLQGMPCRARSRIFVCSQNLTHPHESCRAALMLKTLALPRANSGRPRRQHCAWRSSLWKRRGLCPCDGDAFVSSQLEACSDWISGNCIWQSFATQLLRLPQRRRRLWCNGRGYCYSCLHSPFHAYGRC